MEAEQASTTAMMIAVARDSHRTYDPQPWILDDPYALMLVGPAWRDIRAASDARLREPSAKQYRANLVVRSRYAEDRLVARPYRQYVMLGARLDSFAWRRPDLVGQMRVFEVDHPATQAWKRARVEHLGLPVHGEHVFAPIDFETETLRDGLSRAGLDWTQPTFFSWLGVTMYLTIEAIEAILRVVATCAPGSEVVFNYAPTNHIPDDIGRELGEMWRTEVAAAGEAFVTRFSPAEAEALVERCGLALAEHPTPDVLVERYFSHRNDGLRNGPSHPRLVAARLPGWNGQLDE